MDEDTVISREALNCVDFLFNYLLKSTLRKVLDFSP